MNSGQGPFSQPANSSAASTRVKFVDHAGKQILFVNYANCDTSLLREVAQECHRVLAGQPPGSALTLNDVSGTRFDHESVAFLKSIVKSNAPFVKRAAVVGVTGLQRLIYEAVQAFSKRSIPCFTSRQDALDWLIKE